MENTTQGKAAGGNARALSLSSERKREIALKGVLAKKQKAQLPKAICGNDDTPIRIGNIELQCYVLDDEQRILTLRGLQSSIGLSEGGGKDGARKIPAIMARLRTKNIDIMDLDTRANTPIQFVTTGGSIASGYNATILPDICAVLIKAHQKGLLGKKLEKLGERAAILQHGFATLGIIGLVDKVTGFQDFKTAGEMARLIEAYVAKALQPYLQKFTPKFYSEIFRLRSIPFDPTSVKRPPYFGHLTNDIVYRRMAPGIWKELKSKSAKAETATKPHLHRYLTPDIGDPRLRETITKVTTVMELSSDWFDFKEKLDRILPAFDETMQLPLQLKGDDGKGL